MLHLKSSCLWLLCIQCLDSTLHCSSDKCRYKQYTTFAYKLRKINRKDCNTHKWRILAITTSHKLGSTLTVVGEAAKVQFLGHLQAYFSWLQCPIWTFKWHFLLRQWFIQYSGQHRQTLHPIPRENKVVCLLVSTLFVRFSSSTPPSILGFILLPFLSTSSLYFAP